MTIEQDFFNEYRLMYRPFTSQINNLLSQYQLYNSQWAVLRLLTDKGSCTFADIANFMHIEKPSVTTLVQKLVDLEYVGTVQGKDKREKLVQLTELGEQKVKEIRAHLQPFFEQALANIPAEQIEIATEVLAKICENMNQQVKKNERHKG